MTEVEIGKGYLVNGEPVKVGNSEIYFGHTEWRGRELVVRHQRVVHKEEGEFGKEHLVYVLGWKKGEDHEPIPRKLQDNCRGYLRGIKSAEGFPIFSRAKRIDFSE